MASPTYHTGSRGYVGYELTLTSASGVTTRTVVPAMVLIDETGASISGSNGIATKASALPAGTDRSGVTSASAGTATTLAAANAARVALDIQNISAGTIGINEIGGAAAIGSSGTYTVAAGGSISIRTNRAISVVGSAASQNYTATER